jgi:hypothetical protein
VKDPNPTKPDFEKPATVAYYVAEYPSFFLDDPANPLGINLVKLGGTGGLYKRQGQEDMPARFGNVVANAIDLFLNVQERFPNWNLDGDRGLAWLTWKFKAGYDPDKVDVEPES